MGAEAKRGGNLVRLAGAQAMRLGAGLGVNVLLMRMLGVEGFGVYGYVMTLVGLVGFGTNLGMHTLINREVSRDPSRRHALVRTGIAGTAVLSSLTMLALLGWAALIDGRAEVVLATALAGAAQCLQGVSDVVQSVFHADRRMAPATRAQTVGKLGLLVGTGLFYLAGASLQSVFLAQILDGALSVVLVLWAYSRWMGVPDPRVPWTDVVALVRQAWPFGTQLLFAAVYLSVDVVLVQLLCGDEEVGIYRGAVLLITLFPVVARVVTTGFYPKLSRVSHDPAAGGAELTFVTRVLLAVSLPAAVGGMLVAEPLMVFVGGEAFSASAVPFIILAPLLPIRFTHAGMATALSAFDRQRDRSRGAMLAAIVNLCLNLAVVPRYGAAGAAATTLVTEVALWSFFRWRVGPVVQGFAIGTSLLRVGASVACMAAALVVLPSVHVVVDVAVGVAVFAVCAPLFGALRVADLRRLRAV